jgi:phage-related tail fiber protein
MIVGGIAWIQWNASVGSGSYVLLFCTGAPLQVADATKSKHAVTLAQAMALSPSGAVSMHASNVAPAGWLKANGSTVSRTTYAALFAAIGTTFGPGDGSTTFNLPDLRSEFLRGWDDGRGVDTGRVFGSSQAATIIAGQGGTFTSAVSLANMITLALSTYNAEPLASVPSGALVAASNTTGGSSITPALGSLAYTRPRNVALLFCIKY